MKKKKRLLYGGLVLLAIVIAVVIFLGRYTDRVIDPYVRTLLEETRPMGHKIEYRNIRVNLFRSSIILKDVSMSPDSTLTKDKIRMEISVRKIRLTGFNIWDILVDKTLRINEFLVENPDVKLILPPRPDSVVREVRRDTVKKQRSQLLTHISLEQIVFSGGTFQLYRDTVLVARSDKIKFIAQSIALVRNTRDEPIGYTYGDVSLTLSNIDLIAQRGLYDMSLAEFSFSKSDSTITLEGFRMIPKFDKKEFSKKLEFQNDRFDVSVGQVTIGHIGIQRFIAGLPLDISYIRIDSLNADIYRDKNVRFNFDRFPKFYNESFLALTVPVSIDTVSITNSQIQYGELVAGHPVAGTILLKNFSLQSYDLANQKDQDSSDHFMRFNVQAMVMGEGPMNAEIILPLQGKLHDFECSGSVGAMHLKPLNDMLEPSINIRFNGGRVNRMTFYFTATDYASKGWMEFLYKDIDVVLLKKDDGAEKGFLSGVANFVALSNNPAPGKGLKIVEIGFERDKNKGLINYVWKTIQSGMVRTIIPIKKYQINRKSDTKQKEQGKKKK